MLNSHINLSNNELGTVFLAILLLLICAHFFGYLFTRLNLPRVVGEIFGGIFLGPSGLGLISPSAYSFLFESFVAEGKILSFIYWMGLIFLMFTVGFKVSIPVDKRDHKLVVNLIINATLLPFLGGLIYYRFYDFTPYMGPAQSELSLLIVICIAISVTSIPVISKIFLDLNIIETRFARIVLAASTLQDLLLWTALGIAIKNVSDDDTNIVLIVLTSMVFLGGSLLGGPYLVNRLVRLSGSLLQGPSSIGFILAICLFMATFANYLGVNIVFGALMAGIIVGTLPTNKFQPACKSISDFAMVFFIPIYFAIVGLKINLPVYFDPILFTSFITVSSLLEIGSVYMGLRLMKMNWLTRLNFGLAMNTRGGPGIVIACIAYEFSIINQVLFVVLILAAILTSLISGAWFKYILKRGWPLLES